MRRKTLSSIYSILFCPQRCSETRESVLSECEAFKSNQLISELVESAIGSTAGGSSGQSGQRWSLVVASNQMHSSLQCRPFGVNSHPKCCDRDSVETVGGLHQCSNLSNQGSERRRLAESRSALILDLELFDKSALLHANAAHHRKENTSTD